MQDHALNTIKKHFDEGSKLRDRFCSDNARTIADVSIRIAYALAKENKLLLCGNGGSAADCQHIAGEFVNRFLIDRPPLPAIALTTDTSVLTAIGNDFSYEEIFSKQVKALGKEGDVIIGISTSGNSGNVIAALTAARELGLVTVGLTGTGGGKMAELCDYLLAVDDKRTPLIQEVHLAIEHLICGLTDYYLFENVAELTPYLDGDKPLP